MNNAIGLLTGYFASHSYLVISAIINI